MTDYPYIVAVILLVILSIINEYEWKSPKVFAVSAAILLVFMGLRAPVVGADTYNYVRFFTGESFTYTTDNRDFEPLFTLYNSIAGVLLFKNGILYMLVNTVLVLLPLLILIRRFSYNKSFSILLFFLYGFHFMYFVVLRQVLALAVILLGVLYVQSGRRFRMPVMVGSIIVAYFFHTSAIFALPLYLIAYYAPLRRRITAFAVIGFSFVVGVVLNGFDISRLFNLLQLLDLPFLNRLSTYFDPDMVDSTTFSMMGLAKKSIMGVIVFYLMPRGKLNHWFSKLYLVSIVISNVFFEVLMVERLNLYCEVFAMIAITWALSPRLYNLPPVRKLASACCLLLITLYLTFGFVKSSIDYDTTDAMRMHPYCFFFQDYSDHPSVVYNYN